MCLPAPKRAVWGCFHAARVLIPPPELPDREGVFYTVRPPPHHASHNEATTSQLSSRGVGVLSFNRFPPLFLKHLQARPHGSGRYLRVQCHPTSLTVYHPLKAIRT